MCVEGEVLGLVGGFSGDSWPWQAVKEPQQMHRNRGEEGILQEQTSEACRLNYRVLGSFKVTQRAKVNH